MTQMLKEFHLSRGWNGKGDLNGSITFIDETESEIKLTLTQAQIQDVLKVVAGCLVKAAQETATKLTANMITESLPALENKE